MLNKAMGIQRRNRRRRMSAALTAAAAAGRALRRRRTSAPAPSTWDSRGTDARTRAGTSCCASRRRRRPRRRHLSSLVVHAVIACAAPLSSSLAWARPAPAPLSTAASVPHTCGGVKPLAVPRVDLRGLVASRSSTVVRKACGCSDVGQMNLTACTACPLAQRVMRLLQLALFPGDWAASSPS